MRKAKLPAESDFSSAIWRTWSFVTRPTVSRFAVDEPLSTPAALRRRSGAGGVMPPGSTNEAMPSWPSFVRAQSAMPTREQVLAARAGSRS